MDSGSVRHLAVVCDDHRRVDEVAACFAQVGDTVQAEWFASSEELLARSPGSVFEAVIFYEGQAGMQAEAVEQQLRAALAGASFFHVAA